MTCVGSSMHISNDFLLSLFRRTNRKFLIALCNTKCKHVLNTKSYISAKFQAIGRKTKKTKSRISLSNRHEAQNLCETSLTRNQNTVCQANLPQLIPIVIPIVFFKQQDSRFQSVWWSNFDRPQTHWIIDEKLSLKCPNLDIAVAFQLKEIGLSILVDCWIQ